MEEQCSLAGCGGVDAAGEAVVEVSTFHRRLLRQRDEALAARAALRAIEGEAMSEVPPADKDAMTITELAEALGVRASTPRFWEKSGVVAPERVPMKSGSARHGPG